MPRRELYDSRKWRNLRKLVIMSQGGLCINDNNPAYYVHHKEELTDANYTDPTIALAVENLVALCKQCHNDIHKPSVSIRSDVLFDSEGNLISKPTRIE